MSRYVVTVLKYRRPRGYLMLGRITENLDAATRYPHPSNARQAITGFKKHNPEYTGRFKVLDLYPR